MASVKALESSLVFCKHNFEQADERNAIMSVRSPKGGACGIGVHAGGDATMAVTAARSDFFFFFFWVDGVHCHAIARRWGQGGSTAVLGARGLALLPSYADVHGPRAAGCKSAGKRISVAGCHDGCRGRLQPAPFSLPTPRSPSKGLSSGQQWPTRWATCAPTALRVLQCPLQGLVACAWLDTRRGARRRLS